MYDLQVSACVAFGNHIVCIEGVIYHQWTRRGRWLSSKGGSKMGVVGRRRKQWNVNEKRVTSEARREGYKRKRIRRYFRRYWMWREKKRGTEWAGVELREETQSVYMGSKTTWTTKVTRLEDPLTLFFSRSSASSRYRRSLQTEGEQQVWWRQQEPVLTLHLCHSAYY